MLTIVTVTAMVIGAMVCRMADVSGRVSKGASRTATRTGWAERFRTAKAGKARDVVSKDYQSHVKIVLNAMRADDTWSPSDVDCLRGLTARALVQFLTWLDGKANGACVDRFAISAEADKYGLSVPQRGQSAEARRGTDIVKLLQYAVEQEVLSMGGQAWMIGISGFLDASPERSRENQNSRTEAALKDVSF